MHIDKRKHTRWLISLASEFIVPKKSTHDTLFDGIETKLLVSSSNP